MDARKRDVSVQCSILPLMSTNNSSEKDYLLDNLHASNNLRNAPAVKQINHSYSITQCKNQLRINKMKNGTEHGISHTNMMPAPIRACDGFPRYETAFSSQNLSKDYIESHYIKPDLNLAGLCGDVVCVDGKLDPSGLLTPLNKVNNLQKLESLLVKIFRGDILLVSDFELSGPEVHILGEVLLRKNKNAAKLRLSNKVERRNCARGNL